MRLSVALITLAACISSFGPGVFASPVDLPDEAKLESACARIAQEVDSKSNVYFPGSAGYNESIHHWAASSARSSACAVVPGSAEDIGRVLKIVGELTIPFAVKSGGHINNPYFSSTPGVLIVTTNFNSTTYDAASGTATIDVGQTWDTVYAELQKYNVTVAGVRSPGVGVGGYISGGGYSWLTSEYGLGIDSVLGYELVQPDGSVVNVSEATSPELFWALKGTGNNFGIITRVTMKTIEQGFVWGGTFTIAPEYAQQVAVAFANFDKNVVDPKAALIINHIHAVGTPGAVSSVIVFYNAPVPPSGIFDELLAIPRTVENYGTRRLTEVLSAQDFAELDRLGFEQVPNNEFPLELVEAYFAEVENLAVELANTSITSTIALLEFFKRDFITHAPPVTGFSTPSAWPPSRTFATFPNGFWALYTDPADDIFIGETLRATSDRFREKAAALGVKNIALNETDVVKYTNYAHWLNSPEEIYGSALPTLKTLKDKYDPEGVMRLAGGFKL